MPDPSKKQGTRTSLLLFAAILLQSFSFVNIKYATLFQVPWQLVFIMLGFLCLVLRAVVWQALLKRKNLSEIYPFNSLTQVSTLGFSALLFHETITVYNIVGVLIMMSGIALLSKKS